MQKITLDIDGMKCSMCESHVCDLIRKANNKASKIKANAIKNEASFALNDDEPYDDVINLIEKDGYKVLHIYVEPYKKKFLFFGK